MSNRRNRKLFQQWLCGYHGLVKLRLSFAFVLVLDLVMEKREEIEDSENTLLCTHSIIYHTYFSPFLLRSFTFYLDLIKNTNGIEVALLTGRASYVDREFSLFHALNQSSIKHYNRNHTDIRNCP